MKRGADRVSLLGYDSSIFNLGAYHKGGIQTPGDSGYLARPQGREAVDYGFNVVKYMPHLLVFMAEVPGASRGGYYLDFNEADLNAVNYYFGEDVFVNE